MPESNDDVQLILNGTVYAGWEDVSVRRSLDFFASTFDLTLTDDQAGHARSIKLGSPCVVRIGTEKLITGYIDRIRPKYDGKSRRLTVSGRSKVADLVDCSLPPGSPGSGMQNNQTLLQLATSVAKPFGITVNNLVSGLEPVQIATLSPGQTSFDFLQQNARTAGVRLADDTEGNLIIFRAGTGKVNTALTLGENIEKAEGAFSERDRFSIYYILGQSSEGTDGESTAHISGNATDLNTRYRPTVIHSEGPLDGPGMATRRAEWQRNVQYGRSRQVTYTVGGWRHKDGLWMPNTNVLVKDAWMGFEGTSGKGEWLMIGTVEYLYDSDGKRTRLTVMPKEAYDIIPLPPTDAGEL